MMECIYELIPQDRFITRKELIEKTGLSDRAIRRCISQIKKVKTVISNCDINWSEKIEFTSQGCPPLSAVLPADNIAASL